MDHFTACDVEGAEEQVCECFSVAVLAFMVYIYLGNLAVACFKSKEMVRLTLMSVLNMPQTIFQKSSRQPDHSFLYLG